MNPFARPLFEIGGLIVTDTMVVSLILSIALVAGGRIALSRARARFALEVLYDTLEGAIVQMTTARIAPLVPLVLTQWIFLGAANLAGLLPRVASPTRDLSLSAALAVISLFAGHVHAARTRGLAYLRKYIEPNVFLLPFNLIGEISRTIALCLRLFGNMLSGHLVGAMLLYLAGLLLPVPLMLFSVLTALVQAYIFGVLTLVFAASSVEASSRAAERSRGGKRRRQTHKARKEGTPA